VKRTLFVVGGGVAVGLSYVAVLVGLGSDPSLDSTTIASIAMPALVAGLVMTAYIASEIRKERHVEGEFSELNAQLVRKEIEIDRLSSVDELTGLETRHSFDEHLALEFKRAERFGRPLALLLVEIDDAPLHGSGAGKLSRNYLLSEIAAILRSMLRAHDVGCRYGVETLAVLLPETNATQACAVAGRVRSLLATHEFFGRRFGAALGLSVSQGVAVAPAHAIAAPEALLAAAETALRDAKVAGLDQVRLHGSAVEDGAPSRERLAS